MNRFPALTLMMMVLLLCYVFFFFYEQQNSCTWWNKIWVNLWGAQNCKAIGVCFGWNGLPVPGGDGGQKNNWTLKSEQHWLVSLFSIFCFLWYHAEGFILFYSIRISEEWTNDCCCLLIKKSVVDVVCPRMWMSNQVCVSNPG